MDVTMKKKIIIISSILVAFIFIGVLMTRTSIMWDKELENIEGEVYVSDTHGLSINLKVKDLFFDEEKLEVFINDKPVKTGIELSTQLNGFGTYKLEARYKKHHISK